MGGGVAFGATPASGSHSRVARAGGVGRRKCIYSGTRAGCLGPFGAARGAVLTRELASSSQTAKNPEPVVDQVGAAAVRWPDEQKMCSCGSSFGVEADAQSGSAGS